MGSGRRLESADDLGTRPIGRLLWWTCSQTTLSVGVFGVYALTNAWFVARGVNDVALAAVNLVAPLLLLVGAVSTTVGVGGASIVSRSLGAGRTDDAARAAGNSFVMFWTMALVVTAVGLIFLEPLLRLVGATDVTMPYARPYAVVIIAGAILSTGFSAIVRAEGRLLFSTLMWVIPVLVHITLDPILIFGFDLGVTGAAFGTIGGQAVSAGMALWFFFIQRDRPYRVGWHHLRPDRRTMLAIQSIGAPSFLAGAGATVLAVVVNSRLSAGGAGILAAYAVSVRVQTFALMPQIGITQGAQPIISYNAGMRLPVRVARTRDLALRATTGYGLVAAVAVAVAAGPIGRAFLAEPLAAERATEALRIVAIGYVFAGVPTLISAYFQALGLPAPSYAISIGTVVGIKLPLVLLLGQRGPTSMWLALPLGEALSAAAAWFLLRRADRPPSER